MRKVAWYSSLITLTAALTGCAGTTSVSSPDRSAQATTATVSASASIPATSATGTAATGPLGVLPVPAGATPWTTNTNMPLSMDAYIQGFYVKSAWAEEEGLYTRRGFVSGELEGWINVDGSQQQIAIARFATAEGAISLFDGLTTTFRNRPKPATMVTYAAVGGVGWTNPTLDADGNTRTEIAVRLGDMVIDVAEYEAVTPDAAAAEALLRKQYDSLHHGT